MLGIAFLKKDIPFHVNVAGLEFMDRVAPTLFKKLEQFFTPFIKVDENTVTLDMAKTDYTDLNTIIFKETGINVNSRPPQNFMEPGLAIATGFILPHHVMNAANVDAYYGAKHSSVVQAMKILKTDVLKGWVDTSTGRIGGDFSKIEFNLLCGGNLKGYFLEEMHNKYNVSYAAGLAAFICHECGHVFSALKTMSQTCLDIGMAFVTGRLVSQTESGVERLKIVKDFGKELGVEVPVKEKDLEKLDSAGVEILLSKLTEDRNTRRTLSLGLTTRTSEIYADMYAMKMGCPKSFIVGLSGLTKSGISGGTIAGIIGVTTALLVACPPIGIGLGVLTIPTAFILGILKLTWSLHGNEEYDSPYRRMKNIVRFYASELSNNTSLDARTKTEMLKEAKEMEKIVDECKSNLEGTFVQRLFNWMLFGPDFKAQEFDHYTQELLSHNLSLYTNYFDSKKD